MAPLTARVHSGRQADGGFGQGPRTQPVKETLAGLLSGGRRRAEVEAPQGEGRGRVVVPTTSGS